MNAPQPNKLVTPTTRRNRLATAVTALTTAAVALTVLTTTPTQSFAQKSVAQANGISEKDAVGKYFDMGYDYIDSLVLAKYWEEPSFYEAKVTMGAKMLAFGAEDGELHMLAARSEALAKKDDDLPLWIDDAGFSYDDAELLGDFWKSEDVWESKITMVRMLVGGHSNVLDASLKAAKKRR
ncbi:MAG: hypothetical protein ACI8UO_002317 [Verrucomicrobiales bacterium]|jgi:hypothetical protein